MLRIALPIYLAFSLLAGPALCCCTLVRTAGAIARVVSPSKDSQSEEKCACCKHVHKSEDSSGQQKNTPPSDEPCPCQGSSPQLAHGSAGQELTFDEAGSLFVVPMACDDRSVDRASTSVATDFSHSVDEPFYSAEDLLRVMHLLRC
jgi:hypothetical protein